MKRTGVSESMNVRITDYRDYRHDEIINLYQSVGWTNYTEHPERLQEGYKNSLCILATYHENELAGILRAVGDGATILFIQDIIVLPKYQRMGIGTSLINACLDKYKDVYQIELLVTRGRSFCHPKMTKATSSMKKSQ